MTSINKKLTNRQAIFVSEIAKGRTQRQACLIAYPKSRKWNIQTVDVRACTLMKNKMVIEALQGFYKEEKNNILWDREKATEILLDLLETVKNEQQIIVNCYNKELAIKLQQLENIKKILQKAETTIEKLRLLNDLHNANNEIFMHAKKRMVDPVCIDTIYKCVQVLNKMYGLDNMKCESYNTKESMTIDELKEMANNIIKQKEERNL